MKIAAHSNEQKVLWDTARAFRKFVRQNPPATDCNRLLLARLQGWRSE